MSFDDIAKLTAMQDFIFELIQISLGKRPCLSRTLNAIEWGCLYELAQNQAIVGVCFAGVRKLQALQQGPPPNLYMMWLGVTANIQQRNETVNQQCVELQAEFQTEGFRSCILKGQGIACLYGADLCNLRQPGDIDIWIDGTWQEVMEYVNARTPNREFDRKHTHYNVFDDTVVETHWRPTVSSNWFVNSKLTAYFEKERERQFSNRVKLPDESEICAPTADFQLVHAMVHIYGHFLYEGVGLRQIMDLYFVQFAARGKVHEVLATLEDLGLMRFVGATQYVLQKVFGLSANELMCDVNDSLGNELLEEILQGGNFGQYDHENQANRKSFVKRMKGHLRRRIRLARFDITGVLFAPIGKVHTLLWKEMIIKKYKL